jgi:hypothetical protein
MIRRLAPTILLSGLLPVVTWAQPLAGNAPAGVDQALRERVAQFFQYHVDGGSALRKAMDLVAEDTKDIYFARDKMAVKKFSITDVKYRKDFSEASVVLDVTRQATFGGISQEVTLPMVTNWKVEEGKWYWYLDQSLESITPMGLSNVATMKNNTAELIRQNPDGSVNLPKNLEDPKTVLEHAQTILNLSGLDKNRVYLPPTKVSEEVITYRNGSGGFLNLELYGVPDLPGLQIKLDKTMLANNESATILFRYQPPETPADELPKVPRAFSVRLEVQPFNQLLPINVSFQPPAPEN